MESTIESGSQEEEIKVKLPPFVWKPTVKQSRFLSCPAFELGMGGGAGSGKSDALMIEPLTGIQKKGFNGLILRRKFVDLERSLIQRSHVLYKGRGRYDGVHHRWRFGNQSFIEFGHCQTLKDLNNYYSAQYSYIGIDQAEQFTEEMYLFFFSRVRTINPDIQCKIRITPNPVGVGRGWIKKRFWIGERETNKVYPVSEEVMDLQGRKETMTYQRGFIQCTVWDNPYQIKSDPAYVMRLNQLPEQKKKALLYGDWDAFEGSFFMEWDKLLHVCEPFDVPVHWKRSIAFDWGYTDPTCILWFAEDPESGIIYCYREFYVQKMIDIDVAKEMVNLSKGEGVHIIFYPWDLDFHNPQTGVCMKERMDDIARGMGREFYWKVANKSRLEGWSAVRYLLARREDGRARIQFFKTCKNTIDTFPDQVHDDTNPEDLDTNGNDHCMDAVRGFAATYRNFFERPVEETKYDRWKMPRDVGGAMKMPDGSFRMKGEAPDSPKFNWMAD